MNGTRLGAVAMAAVLLGSACGDDRAVLGPETSELDVAAYSAGAGAALAPATGAFVANVDFATLTLTAHGSNCLWEVEGQLVFSGTLEGEANGKTTALVFASCQDVLSNPPGTFPDVFQSEAEFDGTVNGVPAQAGLVYQGRAQAGGQIDAMIRLSGGVQGTLQVEAQLAVGGSFEGFVIDSLP